MLDNLNSLLVARFGLKLIEFSNDGPPSGSYTENRKLLSGLQDLVNEIGVPRDPYDS